MKTKGRYYKSRCEVENATGRKFNCDDHPSIHISGSVLGMRKLYWGYNCDVVRIGDWVYKV